MRRRKWFAVLLLLAVTIGTVACAQNQPYHEETSLQGAVVSAGGDTELLEKQGERTTASLSESDMEPTAIPTPTTAESTFTSSFQEEHEQGEHDLPATLDTSSLPHRDLFFYYLEEMGVTFDPSPYVPAFMYDTQWREIWDALEAALIGTYEFLRLWIIVGWHVSVPAVRFITALLEVLLPHFLTALQLIAEAVYDLDPLYQAALAATTVLAMICYRQGYVRRARLRYVAFRRDVGRRYSAFLSSLSEKSRLVGLALPHIVFLTVVYVVVFWSPAIVLDLWDNQSLTGLLSVGIPLVRSIRAIHERRKAQLREQAEAPPPGQGRAIQPRRSGGPAMQAASYNEWRPYEACLKYWALWSLVVCVSSVASLFIPSFVASYLSIPTYWTNILLTWMHSPVARGDIALYTLLSPLVNPYANRIQAPTDGEVAQDENGSTNMIMRTLEAFGVMRRQHLHFIKDLWSQGPALIGLMFIFTPGFVTARGALLIGFGFPAYVTMGALADRRTRTYEWWLQYFVVAVIVDYLVEALAASVGWLPLFYHGKLLAMMWLQFPYFRGAKTIFDATHSNVFVAARPPAVRQE